MVNITICGHQNMSKHQVSYLLVLWLLSYVSSTTRRRRKKGDGAKWENYRVIISAQKWYFKEILVCSLDMCCAVKLWKIRITWIWKYELNFQMYGENTNTMAIPIYRVLPYPVIYEHFCIHFSTDTKDQLWLLWLGQWRVLLASS